ncbi:MAG: UbiA family prenyltransferase [Cyclobacteriaceae bacterium]
MLRKTIEVISTLSLDVVAGACISSLFVAEMSGVQLHWTWLLALCICVWLIYTADHLYDAAHINHAAHSKRHKFHQQHRRGLLIALIFTGVAGIFLLFILPLPLLYWGMGGVALVGSYFLFIRIFRQKGLLHKELIIAFLYPAGIFLPSWYQLEEIPAMIWLLYLQFVLLALANLLLISVYEKEIDLKDGHHSFVLSYGAEKTIRLVQFALILFYLSLVANFLFYENLQVFVSASIILLLMGLALQLLIYKPNYFKSRERYRKLADSIFLFPLVLLVLP